MKENEGDSEMMLKMAHFYLRNGQLMKAQEFLSDAYSFKIDDQKTALIYACLLCQL